MPTVMTRTDVLRLAGRPRAPCATIYAPWHALPLEAHQERVTLRHLLEQARQRLVASGVAPADAERALDPVRAAPARSAPHGSAGFVAMASAAEHHLLALPPGLPCPDLVAVGRTFYLRPLLPLLEEAPRFFVLTLSRRQARLLRGTEAGLEPVDVPGMPAGVAWLEQFENPERQVQAHSVHVAGNASHPAMFHGHAGLGTGDRKTLTTEYLRLVEHAVRRALGAERAPLVLAGAPAIQAAYRRLSAYPGIQGLGVSSNPDRASMDELRDAALRLVRPLLEAPVARDLARLEHARGLGRASTDPAEVVARALDGRVETLFAAPSGEQVFARVDATARVIEPHAAWQPGDVDLVDEAAVATLMHKGTVHAVERGQVPGGGLVAAILRL